MARGDVRIAVTLACEECKRRNYQTNKSKRNNPDRIALRKYCKWCRRHTGAPRDPLAEARRGPRSSAREAAPRASAQPGGRRRAAALARATMPRATWASTTPASTSGSARPPGTSAGTPLPSLGARDADVDEARLARGAAPSRAPELPDEGPRTTTRAAPDEVEGDLGPRRPRGPGRRRGGRRRPPRPRKRRGRVLTFLGLRRRAAPRPVAGPPAGRPGHRRRARLRRPRRRLPRPDGRHLEAPRSTPSSSSGLPERTHVPLVRHQHLLRAREQGQAEPRAPRASRWASSAPCARSSSRPRPSRR